MGTAIFHCDWSESLGPLTHFWEHTVGSGHATLALRSDWRAQLKRCHQELGFRYVRFHGLLNNDMSTLVSYKKEPVYSFFNADSICDFLLSIGMRPFVELSFMPEILASGDTVVFHYRGNVTPPRDYRLWATLVSKLARHWVERYGLHEVSGWYFEVWNEPNLKQFWTGSQEDYFKLYRYSAEALKEADGSLRVGGPATAKEEWLEEFQDFCGREKVPVDFISTHHYPNDVIWQEDQDTETQLAHSERSLLRTWARQTRRRVGEHPLYYTEWACSSHPRYPPHDEPYAAAFVVKTVMEAAGLVDCYSFWTFSDLFEENYFPSVPFHGGFGLLNIHGVPKPVYRAFELLHRLGNERMMVQGSHTTVDCWVIRQPGSATVLLTNHALPRHMIEQEQVRVELAKVPSIASATIERIDADHANAKRAWQELGRPEYLTSVQVERLEQASRMREEHQSWKRTDDGVQLDLVLPPHSVSAITLRLAEENSETGLPVSSEKSS